MDPLIEIERFVKWKPDASTEKPSSLRELLRSVGRSHSYLRRPAAGLHRIPVEVVDGITAAMADANWFETVEEKKTFHDALLRLHLRDRVA